MNYRFTLGAFLKYFCLPFIFLAFSINGFAQLTFTSAAPTKTIDFSNSMPLSVGTNPATAFDGSGIMNNPNASNPGYLNSNAWSINGSAYPSLITGQSVATGPVTGGGFYAYTGAPGSVADPALMIQASGSFFSKTKNTIDLRIQNVDPVSVITKIDLSYDIFLRNDQSRSSIITFSYSKDNVNWTAIPSADFASPTTPDALGWRLIDGPGPSRSVSITGLGVINTGYLYLRWNFSVTGTGARDEVGLDNIIISATYSAPCTGPATGAVSVTFANVASQQMDVIVTRGNGAGVMVVASTSAALGAAPANTAVYTANSTFTSGAQIGNGFVVYNYVGGNPPATQTFTLFGLNGNTTYYFYAYEYSFPTSPCYRITPRLANQKTAVGTGTTSPTDWFQSRSGGIWTNNTTWRSSSFGPAGPWINATVPPTNAASGIEIISPHTVILSKNETAKNLFIRNNGILDNGGSGSFEGYAITFNTAGVQFTVDGDGKFVFYGTAPVFNSGSLGEVLDGGMIEAKANNTGGSDDLAWEAGKITFRTGAIFNWNTSSSFGSDNVKYFKDIDELPIFRISANVGNVGAGNPTNVYGLLEVNGSVTWVGAGEKIFRNGITGTGTITQSSGSGLFVLDGIATLGTLSGILTTNLNGPGLDIRARFPSSADAITTLINNVSISGSGSARFLIANVGKFYTDNFYLGGNIPFIVATGGTLGMGSPVGISASGATGNIRNTTARTFGAGGYYLYNGLTDQVTGDGLPATIQRLIIAATGKTVTLTNPTLTISGASPNTTLYSSNFLIPGKTVTFEGQFYSDAPATGWVEGDATTIVQFSGTQLQTPLIKDKSALSKIVFKKTGAGATTLFNFDVNIYTGIEFDPSHTSPVNFQSKNIVLKSTATNTAYLGRQYNNYVSGAVNFTVERYIPSDAVHGKSWQLLAVPLNYVGATQTIHAAWQEGASAPLANPNPGFGTIITGKVANATDPTIGFDILTPVDATVKTYVPATDTWLSIPNTKTLKVATNYPYLILVRGDRSITTYNAPSVPTTLRTNGKIYFGISGAGNIPPVISPTKNKFSTVSNPYASAIDFEYMVDNNFIPALDKVYYAWDPLLHGTWGLGGYQTISKANDYKPIPGNTANYPLDVVAKYIQSGQGFLVHSTDPTLSTNPGVVFNEAQKVTNYNMVFRPVPSTRVKLTSNLLTGAGNMADANVIVYSTSYSDDYDNHDAKKYMQGGENFGIISNGQLLTLEARSVPKEGDIFQFYVSNLKATNYTFNFQPENFNVNLRAFLNDRFLGTKQEISLTDSTNINFNVTNSADSKSSVRFYITFQKKKSLFTSVITPDINYESVRETETVNIFPNPVSNRSFSVDMINFEPGIYNLSIVGANGTPYINRKVQLSQKTQNERFELPLYILPGIYKLYIEGVGGRRSYGVVVN